MELLSKQLKLHNQLGDDHGIWEKFSPSRQIQFQGTCLGLYKYLTASFKILLWFAVVFRSIRRNFVPVLPTEKVEVWFMREVESFYLSALISFFTSRNNLQNSWLTSVFGTAICPAIYFPYLV